MKSRYDRLGSLACTLFALGLVSVGSLAQAKDGNEPYQLTEQDKLQINRGMSVQEVEHLIGRPMHKQSFANNPGGITWVYGTSRQEVRPGDMVFDVDFGANGTVIYSGDRYLRSSN